MSNLTVSLLTFLIIIFHPPLYMIMYDVSEVVKTPISSIFWILASWSNILTIAKTQKI
jgi:hypothetical protein